MSQSRAWFLDITLERWKMQGHPQGRQNQVHISPSCHFKEHLHFKSTIADLLLLCGLAIHESREPSTTAVPIYSRARSSDLINGGQSTTTICESIIELSYNTTKELSWNGGQNLQVSGYTLDKPSSRAHMGFLLSHSKFPCRSETTSRWRPVLPPDCHIWSPCLHRHLETHKQVSHAGVQDESPPAYLWISPLAETYQSTSLSA